MPLTPTIAAYFVIAALLWVIGARLGGRMILLAAVPFVIQLGLVSAELLGGIDERFETIRWIPALDVTFEIRIDALTVVLTSVVATIGLLITIYSARYMSDIERRARFLSLMVLFTGGMAGVVAADDLFGLFVFWEVTTVASYLLIGFDDERAAARAAAVQALLVTTAGGLAMLGGFVLLATAAGTTSISGIVAAPPSGTTVTVALVLIFLGAFTKSAQFPFHFWLPGAMAAPTPASAYLHSATMVKAGIVLLLLLAPGFAAEGIWTGTVTGIGLTTMVVGAARAMRQHDLKLLLAHGTVSQLGFMTALLGLGLTGAALAVLVTHAAFKAALFLVVGIIDKGAGTRDIRCLAGLQQTNPGLAMVAAATALSMAGIPPLLGFVTKEAAFDLLIAGGDWAVLTVMAAASVLTVAYTARLWWGAFGESPERARVPAPGRSDAGMLGPAAFLAVVSVAFGLFPGGVGALVEDATGQTIKLVLWPGFKAALAVSAVVVAAGALTHLAVGWAETHRPHWAARIDGLRLPSADAAYRASVVGLNRIADAVTGIMQNGSLPVYLAVIVTTVAAVPVAVWAADSDLDPIWTAANSLPEAALAVVAAVAAIAAARVQRRMAAALLLGVVGYAVAGIFVTFGAPDLALTQLLIETFTVGLFAFVLSRLPRRFGTEPRSLSRRTRFAVSAAAGVFVTAAALAATSVVPDRSVADFYADNSLDAGGRNIVNVILTDFRALDTLGEITVLAAAGIGIGALVFSIRRRRTPEDET